MSIKNICSGSIIPVHYEYIKMFVEKTDDYKTGISEALIWSYIVQNSWKDGVLPDVLEVNVKSIKDMFSVSNHFIDSMFDTVKVCGILSFYEKESVDLIKFSLSNEDKDNADSKPLKMAVKKRKPLEYTKEFLDMFKIYPKRNKGFAKKPAFIAWQARIKDGLTAERLTKAVKNYYSECESENKIGTSFVLMPQTFFGTNERYEPYLEDETNDSSTSAEAFMADHSTDIVVDSKTMNGVNISNDASKEERLKKFRENF